MMSDPGQPDSPVADLAPRGTQGATRVAADRAWPTPVSGRAVIAVASTGAVTAMNVTAVTLLGPPAPHQCGLGMCQFIPARYHRVVETWSERTPGDARAAHPDPLTLSLSVLQTDGCEVRVLMTRRMLGAGREAPYLVTMRALPELGAPATDSAPRRVRHRRHHPSPTDGWTTDS